LHAAKVSIVGEVKVRVRVWEWEREWEREWELR
jgi:hypothetical protein